MVEYQIGYDKLIELANKRKDSLNGFDLRKALFESYGLFRIYIAIIKWGKKIGEVNIIKCGIYDFDLGVYQVDKNAEYDIIKGEFIK